MEGNDPGRLSDWQFGAKTETDAAIVDEMFESNGAILMGRRMFDAGLEPWGDPPPYRDAGVHRDARGARAGGGIRLFEGLVPEGIELRRLSSIETR
jgi:hypothetical protein